MKPQIEMKIKAGVMSVIITVILPVSVAITAIMATGCDNGNGTNQQEKDFKFSQDNMTFIFDTSIKDDYSPEEIIKFKGYIQEFMTLEEHPGYGPSVKYIKSKDKFTIYIKPLTGVLVTERHEVINDKEIVINSIISKDADNLFNSLVIGVSSDMMVNYPLAQIKHFNNANKPRVQIAFEKANRYKG